MNAKMDLVGHANRQIHIFASVPPDVLERESLRRRRPGPPRLWAQAPRRRVAPGLGPGPRSGVRGPEPGLMPKAVSSGPRTLGNQGLGLFTISDIHNVKLKGDVTFEPSDETPCLTLFDSFFYLCCPFFGPQITIIFIYVVKLMYQPQWSMFRHG